MTIDREELDSMIDDAFDNSQEQYCKELLFLKLTMEKGPYEFGWRNDSVILMDYEDATDSIRRQDYDILDIPEEIEDYVDVDSFLEDRLRDKDEIDVPEGPGNPTSFQTYYIMEDY